MGQITMTKTEKETFVREWNAATKRLRDSGRDFSKVVLVGVMPNGEIIRDPRYRG